MANKLETVLANLLKPKSGQGNNEQVEALQMLNDRINLTDALTVTTSTPESRAGFALVGFSEVA
jgi:hypothetical protein